METVRHIYTLLILVTLPIVAGAQEKVVTGIIQDNRGVPVTGVRVCQVNTSNCTAADLNGIFHLLLIPGKESNLQVECLGFNPVEVVIDESTTYPLNVTLTPVYIPDAVFIDDSYNQRGNRSVMRSTLSLDAVFTDFAEFTPDLGSYNTEVMDYFAVIGPELGAIVSGVYFGLGLGVGYSYKDDYDSLVVDLNNTLYKFSLGYDLVSSTRIRLAPILSVKWLRYRLMNYPNERKITLTSYLGERDIDIRFNQTIAVAGVDLEYIMYTSSVGRSDYWSVGIEGGYAVRLNQTPWVYSKGNRLMTDNQIGLDHLTFGLSLSYYTVIR
ncbi:MAG: carboxypeptidase-like regulatory domain-containing protein [Bacteroidales bacterium]|nr:carboxypeptidase-like regulatory domain-containing protein [Bacteroidales bacterium]